MPEDTSETGGAAPAPRRRRYARSPAAAPALTPAKLEMLRWLAELRFLSLPQLARLCCPAGRPDLSEKSARRHLRALFDAGLVDVLPVSRAALAQPGAPNDASLLYGSAPNVYVPTKDGMRLLVRAGLVGEEILKRVAPTYGPRNGLFLAHELAVRDVRIWLEMCARAGGHQVEAWRDGDQAAIGTGRESCPVSVRPDAWFACRLNPVVLVGLVEVDRGTERGERRGKEKVAAYGHLFRGPYLKAATGYVNARVLVFAPGDRRRDALAAFLHDAAPPELAGRFWVAAAELSAADLHRPEWRQAGATDLRPLVALPESPLGARDVPAPDHITQ